MTSLVGAIALTVLITWMFNNTGGSLIPGSLMHLSINFTTAVMGVSESPTLYAATVGILSVIAVSSYWRSDALAWRRPMLARLRGFCQKQEGRP